MLLSKLLNMTQRSVGPIPRPLVDDRADKFGAGKDAYHWTYLGLLYLHQEDADLANQAFYRAQVLDPDYSLAWVGQGLVATVNGHEPDAHALFEHAHNLSADVVSIFPPRHRYIFSCALEISATSRYGIRPESIQAICLCVQQTHFTRFPNPTFLRSG